MPPPRSRSRTDVLGVRLVAVAAAAVALSSSARPTGSRVVDALWCAALAAVVVLAASRSRRWPWIWLAGVATAGAVGSWWALAAAVGLVGALAGVALPRRNRLLGAGVGALAVLGLLHMPSAGFHGLQTLLAVVAVAPVLWSGYERSRRHVQRAVRWAVAVGLAVALVATAGWAVGVLVARQPLDRAVDASQAGLEAVRAGDQQAAARELAVAADDFATATSALTAPWTWPARLVPVVGDHAVALSSAAQAGEDVTSTAAAAATAAPYQQLRLSTGQIDLAALEAMQAPVAAATGALQDAQATLAAVTTGWLLPPVADALDRFSTQVDRALPEAELADEALQQAPALLGADGPRQYLVLFTNPAETRFLGGFVASYGLLQVDDGRLQLTAADDVGKLIQASPASERSLADDPAYAEFLVRHGRFNPAKNLQNLTAGPDFPTDARVARTLFQQATGTTVDGVLVLDPVALSRLLEITGPIQVPGRAEPLTADTAVEYLYHDQYLDYDPLSVDERGERKDRLADAARLAFETLGARQLPGPKALGALFGPVVDEHRMLFFSFDDGAQPLLDRLGLTGRFGFQPGSDLVSLRTANTNPNKIDHFLHRSISYDVSYDPAGGRAEATATIQLRNEAPSSGLPDYVIGNGTQQPPGTNSMYLSYYTPLALGSAQIDGSPLPIETQGELGLQVYSSLVRVPPGKTVTIVLKLTGTFVPSDTYRLAVSSQPTVHPDRLSVRVRSSDPDWTVASADGLSVAAGAAATQQDGRGDQRFSVTFGR